MQTHFLTDPRIPTDVSFSQEDIQNIRSYNHDICSTKQIEGVKIKKAAKEEASVDSFVRM